LRAAGSFPRERAIAANGQDTGIEIVPVLNGSANPEIGVPEAPGPWYQKFEKEHFFGGYSIHRGDRDVLRRRHFLSSRVRTTQIETRLTHA
jgi:hypothetical protein